MNAQRARRAELLAQQQAAERGANWGVNAQRAKLAERQQKVRRQEQRIETVRVQNRQDLRDAKARFENKVDRTREQLRRRSDRLDHRAHVIRHHNRVHYPVRHVVKHHRPVVIHRPTTVIHKPAVIYKPYRSSYYRHDHYKDHDHFGFSIRIGDSATFHYENGFRRHHCCTGGYYVWRWVPALKVVRYDHCGDPYTVVIRPGYHKRVWITHTCRSRTHYYSPYW